MKFSFISALVSFSLFSALFAGEDITGFWKIVDQTTKKPETIIAIYPHDGIYYGRILITYDKDGKVDNTIYDPHSRAKGLVGDPFFAGLDFIWGLKKEGDVYKNGQIMDPEKNKIYDAEAWSEGDHLVFQGKVLFFSKDQIWPIARDEDFPSGFVKPDLTKLVPTIPRIK